MAEAAPARSVNRRVALGLSAGALMAARGAIAGPRPSSLGQALFADVAAYDALGEHRTASRADVATSAWLAERLKRAGMEVSLQGFSAPLFRPGRCVLEVGGRAVETFPAWPPVATPPGGIKATLAAGAAGDLSDRIALVVLPHGAGASWASPRLGEPVMGAIKRGAAAVVAVTEGPTGDIVALNTAPGRYNWPVPVVLAPGREAKALAGDAAAHSPARLVSSGAMDAAAQADNVIARRPGRGKTVVISTPTSGWFHCAGERGSGVAVSFALADWLTRETDADLLFVGASGHELGYAGARAFLATAPSPEAVKAWLHIGANVAVQEVTFSNGAGFGTGKPVELRRLAATPELLAPAERAFAGLGGYARPQPLSAHNAVGELELFHAAGYPELCGIVGAGPLFHTPLDRTPLATTPTILAPVALACRALLTSLT
ncbi:MAG: hypothetical protein ACRED9_00965 [Caulobacteraceae bacterium]